MRLPIYIGQSNVTKPGTFGLQPSYNVINLNSKFGPRHRTSFPCRCEIHSIKGVRALECLKGMPTRFTLGLICVKALSRVPALPTTRFTCLKAKGYSQCQLTSCVMTIGPPHDRLGLRLASLACWQSDRNPRASPRTRGLKPLDSAQLTENKIGLWHWPRSEAQLWPRV